MKQNLFLPPKLNKDIYANQRIYDMLDKSTKFYHTTYVQALSGVGKTSLVANWIYEHKLVSVYRIFWVNCEEITREIIAVLKEAISIEQNPVLLVWDHYEVIAFGPMEELANEIKAHLDVNSKCCILTKGRIPDSAIGEIAMQRSNVISGLELMYNASEVRQYINVFKKCNLDLSSFVMPEYLPAFPLTLNLIVLQYEKYGDSYSDIIGYVKDQIFWFLKCTLVDGWTTEEYELIKRIHCYDKISKDLLNTLYGDCDKYEVLVAFANKNCYFLRVDGDCFIFTDMIHIFLNKVYSVLLDKEEYLSINREAIRYYKTKKDYERVLTIALNIKSYDEALEAFLELEKTGSHKEFRAIYIEQLKMIPEEIISSHVEIVFWMAINSLVQLDISEFDRWFYIFLNLYSTNQKAYYQWFNMDQAYVYLKLISPSTKVDEFLYILEKYEGKVSLEEFSKRIFEYEFMDMVTFLLYRKWYFEDGIEQFINNTRMEKFLGRRIYALFMLYLGVQYCQSYQMEMAKACLFKATEVCRKYVMNGPNLFGELFLLDAQRYNNKNRNDTLGKKEDIIKKIFEKEDYLRRFDSFYIKIWLQSNNIEKINTWIAEQKRDLYDSHNIVNFRSFLQQIRVQILVEDMYDAQLKLDSLIHSCEEFRFEADKIECYILYAIVCYRRDMMDKAVQYFLKAYWLVKRHKLMQIVVYEGAAIQPILLEVAKTVLNVAYEKEFQELLTKVNSRARLYPKYLLPRARQRDVLTKTEVEILNDLDSGDTLIQIAEKRCISLNTVKQHTKSIYGKLKVNKRNMAIKVAKERGLL